MNSFKNLTAKITNKGPVATVLSVVVSVLLVTGFVQAASTISTNIATDGTLSVTGASTLTGDVSAAAKITSGKASTTVMSVTNTAFFGGTATTTIGPAGNITQPTTNSATTTITVGCIQAYATSTASPVRIEFGATAMGTSTFRTGAINEARGVMAWSFGTCP